MIRTTIVALTALACGLGAQGGNEPGAEAQALPLQDLVAKMKAGEEGVTSAYMEMVTRAPFPGGVTFLIEGTVRVLGETHFHIANRISVDDITSESERVTTPEGIWMREKGPAFGEVYLTMDLELAKEFKEALAVLAGEEGALQNPAGEPLGSAMLESLDRQFELQVERRTIKGLDYYVVQGPTRDGQAGQAEQAGPPGMPIPDRVELLVRAADLAVVQMTQFKAGNELMKIETKVLELNRPMEKASFRLVPPAGVTFKDVREHLPAWTQIQQMLKLADAKREENKEEEKAGADKDK